MFANEMLLDHLPHGDARQDSQSDDVFPFRLHWDAQQLSDAVPLRLHELFDVDAGRNAAAASNAHRVAPLHMKRATGHYAGQRALSTMFWIR